MIAFFRFIAWSAITAGIVVAVLGAGGYWLYREAEGPGPLAEPRTLMIPPHSGIAAIGDLLAERGVIRHGLVFQLAAGLSARSQVLKAGEYEFPARVSVLQALEIIASGKMMKHRLTIPEGLTTAEVMALVRDAPALDGDVGAPPGEGELLPDTYVYSYGETRQDLVERMRRAMAHTLAQLWRERRPDLPLSSPQDALILASVVEKETAREEERAHVAGVFINRLRLGMRLQSDPTVLFALGNNGAAKIDRPLAHADLSLNSPYNTYLAKGLPPGPIANPGRSALRAAVRPERTEDLFFVADGTGGHVFAKTLGDQTKNIALYRRGQPIEADPLPGNLPAADPAAPSSSSAAPAAASPTSPPGPQSGSRSRQTLRAAAPAGPAVDIPARKPAAPTAAAPAAAPAAAAPTPAVAARPAAAPPAQVIKGRRCQPKPDGTCAD
jgi:UPF0755 protein